MKHLTKTGISSTEIYDYIFKSVISKLRNYIYQSMFFSFSNSFVSLDVSIHGSSDCTHFSSLKFKGEYKSNFFFLVKESYIIYINSYATFLQYYLSFERYVHIKKLYLTLQLFSFLVSFSFLNN